MDVRGARATGWRHHLRQPRAGELARRSRVGARSLGRASPRCLQGGGGVQVGQFGEVRRAFSAKDVLTFAALSGDHNPLHVDEEAGRQSRFGGRIVHGILCSSLFSQIFGVGLPGSVYVRQELQFKKPVMLDDEVTARVTVQKITRRFVECSTQCFTERHGLVVDGVATVMVPAEGGSR